jgi:hypothetical protein
VADMRINGPGPGPQPPRPNTRSEAVLKAQKAFFDAARSPLPVQNGTTVQPPPQARPTPPVQTANVAPDTSEAKGERRLLRPGSILDIRV